MEPSRFDDLTKALATATSRRQALKTIAATTLGGILGLGGLGTSFAKNMTCAQWCTAVFGENTPADEQCSADAAHHKGLCYSCGPASSKGGVAPSSICCTRNASGYCSSYSRTLPCSCDASQCLKCDSSTGTCVGCPSGQTCQSGQCVSNCTANGGSCTGVVNNGCCSGLCDQNTSTCVGCIPSGHSVCVHPSDCCSGLCAIGATTNTCVDCIPNGDYGCSSTSDCCSGLICYSITQGCQSCVQGGPCNRDGDCCSGNCSQGFCCDAGQTNCGGICTNTQTDPLNCGGCFNVCNSGQTCVSGQCV